MLLCVTCEGKRIVTNTLNETVVCPGCNGQGHIPSVEESKKETPQQILKG